MNAETVPAFGLRDLVAQLSAAADEAQVAAARARCALCPEQVAEAAASLDIAARTFREVRVQLAGFLTGNPTDSRGPAVPDQRSQP